MSKCSGPVSEVRRGERLLLCRSAKKVEEEACETGEMILRDTTEARKYD